MVPLPALIVPPAALIVPLLINRLANKVAPNTTNIILGNPPFCFFTPFLIVWQTSFINKPDSSKN